MTVEAKEQPRPAGSSMDCLPARSSQAALAVSLTDVELGGPLTFMEMERLAAGLPGRRVAMAQARLHEYWMAGGAESFSWVISLYGMTLGTLDSGERAWLADCLRHRDSIGAHILASALAWARQFGRVAPSPSRITQAHRGLLAWDIQQAACLIRLGEVAGFLESAQRVTWCALLRERVQLSFESAEDYLTSGLAGMAIRQWPVRGVAEWERVARVHRTLLVEGSQKPLESQKAEQF